MTTTEEQGGGSDVAVKIAGQEVNIKNVKSLNTLATVATLGVVLLIAYGGYMHSTEAKDNNKEIAKELKEANKEIANTLKDSNRELGVILKDLARAVREQNCVQALPPERRQENIELCKRISQ